MAHVQKWRIPRLAWTPDVTLRGSWITPQTCLQPACTCTFDLHSFHIEIHSQILWRTWQECTVWAIWKAHVTARLSNDPMESLDLNSRDLSLSSGIKIGAHSTSTTTYGRNLCVFFIKSHMEKLSLCVRSHGSSPWCFFIQYECMLISFSQWALWTSYLWSMEDNPSS